MKTAEHVEYLLRQGKKSKELEELGFPKRVITRVRKKLREERKQQKQSTQKEKGGAKDRSQSMTPSIQQQIAGVLEIISTLDAKYDEVINRLSVIEVAQVKFVSFTDLSGRLAGTPTLGLQHRFKCECGESGYVALQIQCTKCGRKSWWGWFPKQ